MRQNDLTPLLFRALQTLEEKLSNGTEPPYHLSSLTAQDLAQELSKLLIDHIQAKPTAQPRLAPPQGIRPELILQATQAGYPTWEIALTHLLSQLQRRALSADISGTASIHLMADGPCNQPGNMKLSYRASIGYGDSVTANDIHKAMDEVLRRKGWDEKHQPVMLQRTGTEESL